VPDPYGGGPPRPTNAGKIALVVVVVLILMAGSAVVGGLVGAFATQRLGGEPTEVTRVVDAPQLDYTSLASIASDVGPSVVSIRIRPNGQGSGVVLDGDGHILTNAHVVENAQGNEVRVSFSNGEVAPAAIVGADARSDVAVVRVDGVENLIPAKFGDSGELLVGDTVLAIGSPLGFEGSVTQGIISALDRTLQPDRPGEPSLSGLLQTDASINPGNSGGALVNMNGEVIGINTAIATAGQPAGERGFLGVGFAVPSNRALDVARALIAGDEVRHAFLGVEVATAADGGALVGRVQPGSPADEAGLQAGDIVVRLDDRRISDSNDLVSAVQSANVGDTVELEVLREGDTRTTRVTLGELAD
jgi:putative serine protease PepD